MHIHYFQHVPFEGPGIIADWLQQHGHRISSTHFYRGEQPPSADSVDGLVVMGGPMSVNDEHALPWLIDEKQFVRQMIASGKPVLGICLGAQMIASAMGAAVYPNAQAEIGWFPLYSEAGLPDTVFSFPPTCTVLHWHGETFDLPSGAIHLAHSQACRHQAFQLGNNVVGLQFHLEMTSDAVAAITEHCADELKEGEYIQRASQILSDGVPHFQKTHALMGELLQFLFHQA